MKTAAILLMTMCAECICSPASRNSGRISDAYKLPGNMSYEDILYIDRVKNGGGDKPSKSLSPCARAILGCCKKDVMNEFCSENLKCGAFFFDDNPCEEKFIHEALKAAKSFYDQFNSVVS